MSQEDAAPFAHGVLEPGIRSRMIPDVHGLTMHVLEAGYETPGRPLVLLLHGFPELAFSWRKVLVPLANAGFHVVAPDQRGYGRTLGGDPNYDGDLFSYRRLNIVRDALGLVSALGYRTVACVVGHDFGSPVAAWCAVSRPDIFRSVVLMSAPFGGTGTFPFATVTENVRGSASSDDGFAALNPPRRHYQRYYNLPQANEEMWHAPQGIHDFLRGYYHMKSADWEPNHPRPLAGGSPEAMSVLPRYYLMDRDKTMAETVAAEMPSPEHVAANQWLPEAEMRVYSEEYGRTGFQGGLQWYRSGAIGLPEMELYAGRKIEQPSMFVSGASDWGTYQGYGSVDRMREACTDLQGVHLLPGAGHWVQQEQPAALNPLLLDFLARNAAVYAS